MASKESCPHCKKEYIKPPEFYAWKICINKLMVAEKIADYCMSQEGFYDFLKENVVIAGWRKGVEIIENKDNSSIDFYFAEIWSATRGHQILKYYKLIDEPSEEYYQQLEREWTRELDGPLTVPNIKFPLKIEEKNLDMILERIK